MFFLSDAINDSIIINPNIEYIVVQNIKFTNLIKSFSFHNDSIVFGKIKIDTLLINKKNKNIDISELGIDILKSKYDETKIILDSLNYVLSKKAKTNPENAVSVFITSDYFKNINEQMENIYAYYLNKKNHDPDITVAKIEELVNINLVLNNIVSSLTNPLLEPRSFPMKLFFNPGEYKIKSRKEIDDMESYLIEIIKNIDLLETKGSVTIIVAITGYTDDIDVMSDLENELLSNYNFNVCPIIEIETKQECLNRLLSEQRAKHVFEYLKKRIEKHYKIKNLNFNFDISQCIGNGVIYPKEYKGNCSGDCKDRRVVYISIMLMNTTN